MLWWRFSSFMSIVLMFMLLITSILSMPEVVYPVLKRKSRESHEADTEPTRHLVDSEYYKALKFRRALAEYRNKRKRINKTSESRIVVAPIEGVKVYTMDKYVGVVDGSTNGSGFYDDSKSRGTCCDSKELSQNQTIPNKISGVPTNVVKAGKPSVFELNLDNLPQSVVKGSENSVVEGLQSDNQKAKSLALKIPRFNLGTTRSQELNGGKSLMSFIPRQSSEVLQTQQVLFPANSWQLPPELLARRSQHYNTNALVDRRPSSYNTRQNIFEETPQGFYLTTSIPRTTAFNPFAVLTTTTPFPIVRMNSEMNSGPRQIYSDIKDFKIPTFGRGKTHATFAKHNDRVSPIPLPEERESFEETDMDLLRPSTKSFLQTLISTSTLPSMPIEPIIGTQPPDLRKQLYSKLTPNQKLMSCCQKQGLVYGCQSLCNFDNFSDKTLVTAFLTNQCPGPQLGQAFDCASTKIDHTECCQSSNVHLFNGGQCMLFCRSEKPGNVFSYLGCLPVIEVIKQCYREYQTTHPNLFGD